MNEIVDIISSVGFPIFVAIYMLYKTSEDSKNLQDTVNNLNVTITELITIVKGLKNEQT
jgi:hypothetical protein